MVDEAMKIRIAKVLKGANQREIANKIGVSAQAVTKWKKSGTISKENATSLAKLRGFNPDWLISGQEPEKLTQSQRPTIEDPVFLAKIMNELDVCLAKKHVELPAIKKARIIRVAYNDHISEADTITQTQLSAKIIDLFELVA